MRRLLLLTLLPIAGLTTASSAQTLLDLVRAPAPAPAATVDQVVDRIMSFDRDRDGRVAAAELHERMQPVVARGDADLNGALDRDEIRRLAENPAPAASDPFLGSYGFGDEIGFSSRLHIEGAIDDLRLPAAVREETLAAATAFLDARDAEVRADLLHALGKVLTPTQLLHFQAQLDARQAQHMPAAVTASAPFDSAQTVVRVLTVLRGAALEVPLRGYKLDPLEHGKAVLAIERFEERQRLDDADRAALLAQLHPMLDAESHDNLRAALERRPVVSTKGRVVAVRAVGGLNVGQTLPDDAR